MYCEYSIFHNPFEPSRYMLHIFPGITIPIMRPTTGLVNLKNPDFVSWSSLLCQNYIPCVLKILNVIFTKEPSELKTPRAVFVRENAKNYKHFISEAHCAVGYFYKKWNHNATTLLGLHSKTPSLLQPLSLVLRTGGKAVGNYTRQLFRCIDGIIGPFRIKNATTSELLSKTGRCVNVSYAKNVCNRRRLCLSFCETTSKLFSWG